MGYQLLVERELNAYHTPVGVTYINEWASWEKRQFIGQYLFDEIDITKFSILTTPILFMFHLLSLPLLFRFSPLV
jgi:hypothetical protein